MAKLHDVLFPAEQQEGTQSRVAVWHKKVGDQVTMHEPLLDISTDKVTVEIPAPVSGVLREILKNENDEIVPGELLARIEPGEAGNAKPASSSAANVVAAVSQATTGATELSPAVRNLLKQHNISPDEISGTGRGGRITHEDVENYIKSRGTSSSAKGKAIQGKLIPHSPMRRAIADHMVQSMLRTAPHVTTVFEADLSAVISHREKNQDSFQKRGVKLTYTAYFIAAATEALRKVPDVNSRWHDSGLELLEDINIGVATALTESGADGLIVPVIQQTQKLDLFGIAEKLQDFTNRARTNALSPQEVQGGTFTITNHGVSGSLIATPIINQPQSAILGVGKMQKRMVVETQNGKDVPTIRPMCYVTLTIDHRVLDGFKANTFLQKFVEALESYS